MFSNIGDSELIYLIRSENYYAKDYLIERYKKRIYGMIKSFAMKNCINKLDYEEYYQDCFIVFLKCLEMFDDEYNFYTYLNSAINKQLYKMFEKEKNEGKVLSFEFIYNDEDSNLSDIVSDKENNYYKNDLAIFIDENFTSFAKQILEYKLKGYSYLEIAAILSVNKKRVYNEIYKMREILNMKWINIDEK